MKNDETLRSLCPNDSVYEELLDYTKNKFNVENEIPESIPDEPFISIWSRIIGRTENEDIQMVINEEIPHGDQDVVLQEPESVKMEIYNSVAGNIPIIYVKHEDDFYELVTKIINKGKVMPNLKTTGASFAFGKNNKFIVLSNKPYSNIPANEIGLSEDVWKDYSMIIRREHESTHYFTKRFLGSSSQNLHDELVADFAGMYCAANEFPALWFLKGMGIDKYPEPQKAGRFEVYTTGLSEDAKKVLKGIIVKVAHNVEEWAKKDEVKNMSRNERIIFLCKNSLMDLYNL